MPLFAALLAAALVAGCVRASPAPASCTNLVVAAGQSNMEGHGWPYQTEDITADPRIWDTRYADGAPVAGYERYDGSGARGSLGDATTYRFGSTFGGLISPKGTFLRAYADNYTGPCRIQILSCNWGGTGFLVEGANCPTPTGNMTSKTWDRSGSCRETCRERAAAAASNTAMNGNVTVVAILWHQGEFNADLTYDNYSFNILQLIDDWRGLNGPARALAGAGATTPFIVGGLNWGSYTYSPSIAVQIALAYVQFNRTRVGYASSIGIWQAGLHFTATDARTLGARYFAEFLRITANATVSAVSVPAPNCTGVATIAGVPAGTRAFYPLDGRLDDCGPHGLLPLVSDPGYNQTVRYSAGPYPRNSTSLHLGALSTGYSPMVLYDPQAFDRVHPVTLFGSTSSLMPLRGPTETTGWVNSNQSATVSLWVYSADAYSLFAPLQFNGFSVFTRGRPGLKGVMGSVLGVAGCAYSYETAAPYPVRRWMHFAVSTYNSTASFYIDGTLVTSYRDCNEPLDLRNTPVVLGRRNWTIDTELYFQWFRVYDRLLSAGEVVTLYAAERVNVTEPSAFVSRTPSTYRYTFDLLDPLAELDGGPSLVLRPLVQENTVIDFQMLTRAASSVTIVATPNPPPSGLISGTCMQQFPVGDARAANLFLPEPMLQWSVCMGVHAPILAQGGCVTFGFEYDARPDTAQSLVYAPVFTACANNSWSYSDNAKATWTGNGTNASAVWHHICVTVDYARGSNYTVYYNGAAKGSGTRGDMTRRPALLGIPLDAWLMIDNVWMRDAVATPAEIQYEYLDSTTTGVASTLRPTAAPTPAPTFPPETRACARICEMHTLSRSDHCAPCHSLSCLLS
jgi:hypothetical protein